MKKFALVAMTALTLVSSSAFARFNGPILVKTSGGGFTPPEWSMNETCEVFATKVVITRTYGQGELVAKEVRPLSLTGTSGLAGLAAKAAVETLDQQENNLCDAPGTSIYINQIQPNDTVNQVTLFSSGGCGSPRLQRNGGYAAALRDLVSQYCSKNFDMGGN